MYNLTEIFSNREIALFFWVLLALVFVFFNSKMRSGISRIFHTLFAKQILISLALFFLYIYFLILILVSLKFWDYSLIKDSIFWVFGFAIVLVFNLNKAKSKRYFFNIIKDALKWTIILEFIISFYTFSLLTELFLLPILTFLVIIQTVAGFDPEHKQVEKFLKGIFSFIGFIILGYVGYKTFSQAETLLTIANLKSFLLPVILSLLFIPFVYFLALYAEYEALFIRINYLINDQVFRKAVKKEILKVANLDIDKLVNISKNIAKMLLINKSSSLGEIRKISRSPISVES